MLENLCQFPYNDERQRRILFFDSYATSYFLRQLLPTLCEPFGHLFIVLFLPLPLALLAGTATFLPGSVTATLLSRHCYTSIAILGE